MITFKNCVIITNYNILIHKLLHGYTVINFSYLRKEVSLLDLFKKHLEEKIKCYNYHNKLFLLFF